jgi:phage-related protein
MGSERTYRINEKVFSSHKEYWIEKSVQLLGIHLFWKKTSKNYYDNLAKAKQKLNELRENSN